MTKPRVKPLTVEEMDQEQAEFLAPYADRKGRIPNVFATLVRNVKLLKAWSGFGLHTMQHSEIDPVLREVAILRTALNVGSDYEWHHHCAIGRRLGMSDALFEEIRSERALANEEQQLMVACADDLARDKRLSDRTWRRMQETFGVSYTLEVIFAIGAYTTLGMALNSCGVELE